MILLYYVIKECNHGTNPMNFCLFREQRPPNIFCQELFRDRVMFLLFQFSDVK